MSSEESSMNLIVNLKLPDKRFYNVAWSIALLKGYDSLDEFISDIFIERIEMYPDGYDSLENIHWGFKTRQQQEEQEKEKEKEVSQVISGD